jgi:putative transposase
VIPTARARSPCPASARSGCIPTPAGCGACSPRIVPRSCSPSSATMRAGGGWSLNVQAAELHPAHRHPACDPGNDGGWVGVDRGLSAFVVAAREDGTVVRVIDAPKALAAGMRRQRRLAKSLSRKQKGSHNRRDVAAKLGRHHNHVANVRRHFLHQVSNALVKTHGRLVIENLNVSGTLANRRLSRAIFRCRLGRVRPTARLQTSLARRRTRCRGSLVPVEQAMPAMRCHQRRSDAGRSGVHLRVWIFRGPRPECCGQSRPLGPGHHETSPDPRTPKQGGRATNARRRDGADQHPMCAGETSPDDAGTDVQTAPAD